MDGMSLLDVLRGVMLDPAEQAAYHADPGAYLQQYGYDDVDPADLSEAFGLVADTLPPDQAQAAWAAANQDPFGALGSDADGEAFGSHGLDAADLDADALDSNGAVGDGAPGEGYGDEQIVIDVDADDVATLSFGVGEPPEGDAPPGLGQDDDGLSDQLDQSDFGDADGDGLVDALDLDDGSLDLGEPGEPGLDDGFTDDDGHAIDDDFDTDDGGFGGHHLGGFGGEDDPADTDIGSF
jgi:hypothetical protein